MNVQQPNNLRNRYRRYRAAYRAYNWSGPTPFRQWAKWSAKDSYSAPKLAENFSDLLLREKPRPFKCSLCGQRINDGKPCGCGARR